jgi:hypothetical protein
MSNKTYIKDMNNRTIVSVQTQGNITRLNDSNNRTVGTYNSKTDTTVHSNGTAIGRGNQLLRIK